MIRENIRNHRQWRSATSLSEEQFDRLVELFAKGYEKVHGKSFASKLSDSPKPSRIKEYDELLLLTLFYLKTGVTFDVLGVIFGIDGSSAQRNFEKGLIVLQQTLSDLNLLPKRSFSTLKEFEEHMKGEEKILIDATEIRVLRPSDNDEQKDMYSGKKNAIQ